MPSKLFERFFSFGGILSLIDPRYEQYELEENEKRKKNEIVSLEFPLFSQHSMEKKTVPRFIVDDPWGSSKIKTFVGCKSFKHFTIPNGIITIGRNAFSGCTSLETVVIPDSVTHIEDGAFKGCSSLKMLEIPKNVKEIGESAFEDCTSLIYVNIPSKVNIISNYAFAGCSSLKSISIPSTVTKIGNYAFGECSSLESIEIPSSVTTIGILAFSKCDSLIKFDYPETSGGRIYGNILSGCGSLSVIVFPENICLVKHNDELLTDCKTLTNIRTPDCIVKNLPGLFENYSTFDEVPDKMKVPLKETTM